jgi:hypothetical protein
MSLALKNKVIFIIPSRYVAEKGSFCFTKPVTDGIIAKLP